MSEKENVLKEPHKNSLIYEKIDDSNIRFIFTYTVDVRVEKNENKELTEEQKVSNVMEIFKKKLYLQNELQKIIDEN